MTRSLKPGPSDRRGRPVPRISVIIPTWNRRDLLEEVLEALDAQSIDPDEFEVLVMDNRSTDGTAEMIEAMAARVGFPILHHVMPENRGPARSRNVGAGLARGVVLAFTDSDCRPSPRWLELGVAPFRDPAVGFATGMVRYKPEQLAAAGFFARDSGEVLEEHPTYTWTNVFYRRTVFLELGGSDESLCMPDFRNRVVDCGDTDLAWRAKEAGHRNVFVPDALVYHEREVLSPLNWICEPYRLFVLGALVKRHPALRRELLHWNLFFLPANAFFYLAVVGLVLAPLLHPAWALLALPFFGWSVSLLRNNFSGLGRAVARAPRTVVQIGLLTVRHAVFAAGLIYGSIKFRTVVL